jgi:hypothetical protein
VPACESYPHSELWGERGFTYRTLDEALVKHRQMVQGTGSSAVSSAGSVNTLPVLKTSRGAQMQLELEAA